jgi:hypothetical protein
MDKLTAIICDDEMINDYEFGRRIYLSEQIEDMDNFSYAKSMNFSMVF